VKIHDFGMWFCTWGGNINDSEWSTTIPHNPGYKIHYDGKWLGLQFHDFSLRIYTFEPHIIKLKKPFISHGHFYDIGQILTLDDFEIVENPNYIGTK
jgi:hypothetical protein